MKKKYRFFIIILVVLGLGGYLFFSNYNFFRGQGKYIKEDNIDLLGWEQSDAGFVSGNDSQLVLYGVLGKVDTLRIEAQLNKPFLPIVYYTTYPWERFTEDKKFIPAYEVGTYDVTLLIQRSVWSLRVDLTDTPGLMMTQPKIYILPANFQINIIEMLWVVVFCILLGMAVMVPRSIYKYAVMIIQGLRKYTFLLNVLVKRDLTTKYRRSILGVLWSVLNPLLMMIVITVVFQKLFRFQVENFPIYYLTGSLLFNFMTEATSGAMGSIVGAGALIRKVYMPKYIFPLEKCLFALVNMLFSFIATIIMTFALGIRPSWTMLLFPIPIACTLMFSIGFGMILATINVFFRDVSHLYSVWTTAWMYLTPIIYPVEILPKVVISLIKFNPLYHFVNYFRNIIMYGTMPGLRENMICIFFAVLFFVLGILVFRKKQDNFILHI